MMTRDEILAKRKDLPREAVEVPDLGRVFVRAMTCAESEAWQAEHALDNRKNFVERLAVATVCDADGVLLFTAADVAELSGLPVSALAALVEPILRINRMDAGATEALRKNSEAVPT